MTDSDKFDLLTDKLREIAFRLSQSTSEFEREPLIQEFRILVNELDDLLRDDAA